MSLSCPDHKPCEAIPPRSLDLEELRWNRRVLLVFAPARTDEEYPRIAAEIGARRDALEDRDIDGVFLFVRGPGRWGERPLASPDAAHYRHRFEVDDDEVAVILLERSGQELVRQSGATFDLDRILGMLEETPMRQHELMDKRRAETVST